MSERQDLNLRPLRPERSALARLSYAPFYFGTSIDTAFGNEFGGAIEAGTV
jgi:hypothetical protein